MIDPMTVPTRERGIVRLFDVTLPPDAAEAFAADPEALARALGVARVDPGHVDVFRVERLADLGLAAYLSEGHGVPPEALVPDADRLAALDGHVAVVRSRAFPEEGAELAPRPPLALVGAWPEDRAPVSFAPLPDSGAAGMLAGPPGGPVPPSGRRTLGLVVALLALLLLAALLLGGVL